MKLVRPSYEIIEQGPGQQGIYNIIEKCGKTSYKSEVKGGETAEKFVKARSKEGHGAVLEFGTVYLDLRIGSPIYDGEYIFKMDTLMFIGKIITQKSLSTPLPLMQRVLNIRAQYIILQPITASLLKTTALMT